MKYLIVGLGNMGPEYDHTRHNVGFEVIDHLANSFEVSFKNEAFGDIASFRFKGRTFLLLKPSTYVNRSGKAVRYWMQKSNIDLKNLLIVLDDLQLPFGKVRLRAKGNDGGHNGLKDINDTLGTNEYSRLRIGIGSDFPKGGQVDYVLGTWTSKESEQLPEIIKQVGEMVISYCTIGLAYTLDKFSRK